MRFRNWNEIQAIIRSISKHLKDKPRIIAIGGTALIYYNLKKSTKDLDFVFPTQSECFWFADALEKLGFEIRKGSKVWRFINFEKNLFIDMSYGKVGDVSITQSILSRLKKEKINNLWIWIPSLEDLFIMKVCHAIDTYESDAIGDVKRIYKKIDLKIVESELINQNEKVNDKIKKFLEIFDLTSKVW